MPQKLTDEEIAAVKAFLRRLLAESHFNTRWELAWATGVSDSSINEWLSPKGSLPSALHLLQLLQATDALEERFRTPVPTRRPRRTHEKES